jgi:hypothetical protein
MKWIISKAISISNGEDEKKTKSTKQILKPYKQKIKIVPPKKKRKT